jgi:hypothetical protein
MNLPGYRGALREAMENFHDQVRKASAVYQEDLESAGRALNERITAIERDFFDETAKAMPDPEWARPVPPDDDDDRPSRRVHR